MPNYVKLLFPLAAALLLNACSLVEERDGGPSYSADLSHVPDPVPQAEPRSRYGNPASYEVNGQRYVVLDSADGYSARGIASWYGTKFHGKRTSSGETYDMNALTAAHTTLPLPSYVRVTNLNNGRSVVVRVNDRGPFQHNRLIDLSYAAASKLGIVETGTGLVEVTALNAGERETGVVATGVNLGGASAAPQPAGLYLQVGAFSSRSNAEQVRNRLSGADLPPVQIQQGTDANNSPIFRVRMGPIANVEEADRLANRVDSLGLGRPIAVID